MIPRCKRRVASLSWAPPKVAAAAPGLLADISLVAIFCWISALTCSLCCPRVLQFSLADVNRHPIPRACPCPFHTRPLSVERSILSAHVILARRPIALDLDLLPLPSTHDAPSRIVWASTSCFCRGNRPVGDAPRGWWWRLRQQQRCQLCREPWVRLRRRRCRDRHGTDDDLLPCRRGRRRCRFRGIGTGCRELQVGCRTPTTPPRQDGGRRCPRPVCAQDSWE